MAVGYKSWAHSSVPLYTWLFLAGLLVTVGAFLGSPATGALGLALLAVAGSERLRLDGLERVLKIQRLHAPRCFEGESVQIRLKIRNKTHRAFDLICVADKFTAGGGRSAKGVILQLLEQSEVDLAYHQVCNFRRGLFVLGPTDFIFTDALGLFQRSVRYHVYTDLMVCPRPVRGGSLNFVGMGTLAHVGTELLRRPGRSEQFAGVRRYRSGDDMRFVHWPTSVRTGALHVKEFDLSMVTEVVVFIDFFQTGLAGLGALTSCEQRLRVAAAFVSSALLKNHRVQIIAAQQPTRISRLGGGVRHLEYLLDWLALLSPRGTGSFEEVLIEHLTQIRRGSTLVLILSSTNVNLERLDAILRLLKTRQIRVLAAVIEDQKYYKLRTDQIKTFNDAPPVEAIVARLKLAGCQIYTVEQSLDALSGMRQDFP